MYTDFFGLREPAFNNTYDPRYFFSTPEHEAGLASLIYPVGEMKGLTVLTGESGTGKTFLTQRMLAHFGGRITFAEIGNTRLTEENVVSLICSEFGIDAGHDDSPDDRARSLQEFLIGEFAENRPAVVIVDDAHCLSVRTLEELRFISAMESQHAALLQIILVGQPELIGALDDPSLGRLRQRCFRTCHLPELSREQLDRYLKHRLAVAGTCESIFDGACIDAIHEIARGVPRLVNTLCDNVLLSAFADDSRAIDARLIRSTAQKTMSLRCSVAGQVPRSPEPIPEATDLWADLDNTHVHVHVPPQVAHPVVNEALVSRLAGIEERIAGMDSANHVAGGYLRRMEGEIGSQFATLEQRIAQWTDERQRSEQHRHMDRIANQIESLESKLDHLWKERAPRPRGAPRESIEARRARSAGNRAESFARRLDRFRAQMERTRHLVACVRRDDSAPVAVSSRSRSVSGSVPTDGSKTPNARTGAASKRVAWDVETKMHVDRLRDRLDSAAARSSETRRLLHSLEGLSTIAKADLHTAWSSTLK